MIKKIIFRLSAILIGCISIFAALELGLRIFNPQVLGFVQFSYDPELGCIPVPYQKGRVTKPFYTYTNNSWGLRGAKEYGQKRKNDLRIIMLGDSFTYGLGVNDNQTFAYLLEKELLSDKFCVEIINAGSPGKGTDYALKFFQARASKLNPGLVILCFNKSDFEDNQYNYYYEFRDDGSVVAKSLSNSFCAKKTIFSRNALYNWLINHSYLANYIKKYMVNSIRQKEIRKIKLNKNTERMIIAYPAEHDLEKTINQELTAKYIRLLNKEIKKSGLEFVIFYIALHSEIKLYREKSQISTFENDFREIVNNEKITYFSTTKNLAESDLSLSELYFLQYHDVHLTLNGHRLVADFMSNCLKKLLLTNILKTKS